MSTPLPEQNPNVENASAPDAAPLRTSEMYDQSWLGSILRPLLIVVMVGCLALVMTTLMARFFTDTAPAFFVGVALLAVAAAIVGSVTTTVLAQPSRRAYRSLSYRAAEIGLFLTVTRIYVWIVAGNLPDPMQMFMRPLDTLLDGLFVGSALIVGLTWFFAVEMTDDFNRLALRADEFLHGKPRPGLANEAVRGGGVDRGAVLSEFTIRWVTLGLTMIMLAALLRREFTFTSIFGVMRQDVEPSVLAPIIIYFMAGLLLLSHGRLAQLRSRWTMEQTPAQTNVTRRWPWEVVALVGGVALLALFLPLGGTFLLGTILATTISVLFAFVLILYRLVGAALMWIFSLFAGETPPPAQSLLPATQSVQTAQVQPYHPVLPPWAGGAFFWAVLALLVAYAAFIYLRDKGVRFAWLDWLWLALARRWAGLRASIKNVQRRLNLAGNLGRPSRGRANRFDFGRRTWNDPDQQVRHLYLTTLSNAEVAGLPRRPGETPYAYAPRLAERLATTAAVDAGETASAAAAQGEQPDQAQTAAQTAAQAAAMDAITDAFVDVRYAGAHANAEQVSALQQQWHRLQEAIRKQAGDDQA